MTRVQKKRHRWPLVLLVLAMLLVVIIGSTPYTARYFAKQWLLDNGAESVEIGQVLFNPLFGRVGLSNVHIVGKGGQNWSVNRVMLDVSTSGLLSKTLTVDGILVDGLDVTVEKTGSGELRLVIPMPESPTEPEPEPIEVDGEVWKIALQSVAITNSKIQYLSPEFSNRLTIKSLNLGLVKTWGYIPTGLKLVMAIDDLAEDDQSKKLHLSSGDITLKTKFKLDFNAPYQLDKLHSDNELLVESLHFSQPDEGLLVNQGEIDWKGELNVALKAEGTFPAIETIFSLSMDKGELKQQANQLAFAGLQLLGEADIEGTDWQTAMAGQLKLGLQGLQLKAVSEQPMTLALEQLAVDDLQLKAGEVSLVKVSLKGIAASETKLALALDSIELDQLNYGDNRGGLEALTLSRLVVEDQRAKVSLLTFDQLNLAQLSGSQSLDLSLKQALLTDLRLLDGAVAVKKKFVPLASLQSVALSELAYSPETGVDLNQLHLAGIQSTVRRLKNGDLESADKLLSALERETSGNDEVAEITAESKPENQSEPMPLRIGEILVDGENQINFSDRSVSPVFKSLLLLKAFRVTDLDSKKPDQPSPLKLIATLDKHTKISAAGNVWPLQPKPSSDVKIKISSFELPPLSLYAVPVIGYQIETGQLASDIHLKINRGQLDSLVVLKLHNLRLDPADADVASRLTKQISMPLDTALGLLADEDRNLRLKVPVKGDIENPDFDFNKVIGLAVSKATKMGAMSLLKNALQPYGALITVGEVLYSAGKKLSVIKLEPVVFAAPPYQLSEKQLDYLNKVVGLMKKQTGMRLRLCGYGTPVVEPAKTEPSTKDEKSASDAPLRDPLTDATLMANLVKAYLTDQGGIAADRLFACVPRVDAKPEARSRVELLL